VISITFTFEWKPETSFTFEDDVRSVLDSHLAISRFALPFTGGAATCMVSVPSGSQISLVSLLSGFTFTVNSTPCYTGRVCIPSLTPHSSVFAVDGSESLSSSHDYDELLNAVFQFWLICQPRKNHIAPKQVHNGLPAAFLSNLGIYSSYPIKILPAAIDQTVSAKEEIIVL
jgi:hypothetical protein